MDVEPRMRKAPTTRPAQAECIYDKKINGGTEASGGCFVMLFYRVLFWLVIAPSLAFMIFAAIADSLAWVLDGVLDAIQDKGWPK